MESRGLGMFDASTESYGAFPLEREAGSLASPIARAPGKHAYEIIRYLGGHMRFAPIILIALPLLVGNLQATPFVVDDFNRLDGPVGNG